MQRHISQLTGDGNGRMTPMVVNGGIGGNGHGDNPNHDNEANIRPPPTNDSGNNPPEVFEEIPLLSEDFDGADDTNSTDDSSDITSDDLEVVDDDELSIRPEEDEGDGITSGLNRINLISQLFNEYDGDDDVERINTIRDQLTAERHGTRLWNRDNNSGRSRQRPLDDDIRRRLRIILDQSHRHREQDQLERELIERDRIESERIELQRLEGERVERESNLARNSDIRNENLPNEIRNIDIRPLRLRRLNAIRRLNHPSNINFGNRVINIVNESNFHRLYENPSYNSINEIKDDEGFDQLPNLELEKTLKDFSRVFKRLNVSQVNPIFSCYTKHSFCKWNNYDLEFKLNKFLNISKTGELFNHDIKKRRNLKGDMKKRRKLNNLTMEKAFKLEPPKDMPGAQPKEENDDMKDDNELIESTTIREQLSRLRLSSYFKIGSSFDYDYLNLLVSNINYHSREVTILMTILPMSGTKYMANFEKFMKFIIPKMYECKKTELLTNLVSHITHQQVGEEIFTSNPFKFEMSGELIDFKNNDLRFLNNSNYSLKNLHMMKIRNTRIQYQILKWLDFEPFKWFKNYLFGKLLKFIISQDVPNITKFLSIIGFLENYPNLKTDLKLTLKQVECYQNLKAIGKRLNRFKYASRIEHYRYTWKTKILNHFIEFLTCEKNCILNILINFNLCHFTINTDEFLNCAITYLLKCFPNEDFQQQFKSCNRESEQISILGSLNRKNGNFELLNSELIDDNNYFDDIVSLVSAKFTRGNENVYSTGGGDQVCEFI